MRDDGITVLDVGSGPGASAFATRDFYAHLAQYAESHEVTGLKTPPPIIYPVESSSRMVHVMHWISELSGRSGPSFRKFENFNGLDFGQLRLGVRDAAIKALTDDGEDWGTISNLLDWQDQLRFNLGIFSYFLTQEKTVSKATQALTSLFQSMRAGGVVVTAGGVADRYRRVYKKLGKIARPELMERIKAVPPRLPTSTDEYSARMKAVYEKVWRRLESSAPNLEPIKAKLPRDLWDSEVPLKWAPWFGVRVFRRMDIKPERHSWHKNKIARERRTKNVPKQ